MKNFIIITTNNIQVYFFDIKKAVSYVQSLAREMSNNKECNFSVDYFDLDLLEQYNYTQKDGSKFDIEKWLKNETRLNVEIVSENNREIILVK